MTVWQDYMLEFRASDHTVNPASNPEHAGFTTGVAGFYGIGIGVRGLLPAIEFEGDMTEAASGLLRSAIDKRQVMTVQVKPQWVRYADYLANLDQLMQPFAYWNYFVEEVLGHDDLWLYAAHKVGDNAAAGMIPRSVLTRTWNATTLVYDEVVTDELWNPKLPMLVVVSGAVTPSPNNEQGTVDIGDFKLLAARLINA